VLLRVLCRRLSLREACEGPQCQEKTFIGHNRNFVALLGVPGQAAVELEQDLVKNSQEPLIVCACQLVGVDLERRCHWLSLVRISTTTGRPGPRGGSC
jgi:hypothetical protein